MVAYAEAQLIGRRYLLQNMIGQGGMGVVYRAVDRLTGQPVALKRVLGGEGDLLFSSHPSDSTDLRLSLAQEFETLASLRHPNIISVLDYGFDAERQPYFTMNLLENSKPFLTATEGKSLDVQINLLVQMLQALAYLHRRGVLHRDMKPANVVVSGGQVKVLDFGLAIVRERATIRPDDTTIGTLAYLAPEMLAGTPPSPASDLYAVGVMIYEMFTGGHPFDVTNITRLIIDTQNARPDLTREGIAPEFVPVLGRLLDKDPITRFNNAHDVIVAFCEAANMPVPPESAAIRESFLQAAHFVGRQTELSQLVEALLQASQGVGSAWLVGGESGVGKSRLLDELRASALVRGALVLRGQEVSEAGVPYQLWREPLRWLALVTDLTPFEASVLKLLIPDIGTLLGRDVADAPELDAQASQDRLLGVIDSIFQRQTQPIVAILEDIHWATESLNVLARLVRNVRNVPLLLIGTYRDDERPDLPNLVRGTQILKLHRLPPASIAELSESMLGSAGRDQDVVDFLVRETEGNVFFLVEVVRVLAEEAGELDNVGKMALPEHVLAGGVSRIVERRLNRVPENARALLQLAAVAGRQLDLDVLQCASPKTDIDQWLDECAAVAVLDLENGRWQFAHDKLRDGLLTKLTPDQRRDLHRQIAVGLETAHPEAAELASVLAYHWSVVGDAAKECRYALLAGEQSLRSGANKEAVKFLTRALVLDAQLHPDLKSEQERMARARWERQLGEAYNGLGSLNESLIHLGEALRLLGHPLPATPAKLNMDLLRQVGHQLLHRMAPPLFVGRAHAQREKLLEMARIHDQVAIISYSSDNTLGTLHGSVSLTNEAEIAGPSPELAIGYSGLAPVCGIVALHPLARAYRRRALNMMHTANDPYATARVTQNLGLYNLGIGNWDDSAQQFKASAEAFASLGYQRRSDESLGLFGNTNHYIGNFTTSLDSFNRVRDNSKRREDLQIYMLVLTGAAENLLRLGRIDEGAAYCEEATAIFEDALENEVKNTDALNIYGPTALTYLIQGDIDRAKLIAAKALQSAIDSQVTVVYRFSGYRDLAQTYVEFCELAQTEAERSQLLDQARQACTALHKFARIFPIAKPHDMLYSGQLDWFSGQQERALKSWNKALETATRMKIVHGQALIHYEIGRHLEKTDPARKQHLTAAIELFERLSASPELERAKAIL